MSSRLPSPSMSVVSHSDADAPATALGGVSRATLLRAHLKIGLLAFGGTMPWARRVYVDERGWLDDHEFAELLGICQVLPGPNVVNLAVIVGARAQGPMGSLLALTGILFVPVVVAVLIAMFYTALSAFTVVHQAIAAASAAGAGLIVGTAVRLLLQTRPAVRGMLMCAAAFVLVGLLHLPLLRVLPALCAIAVVWEWRASA